MKKALFLDVDGVLNTHLPTPPVGMANHLSTATIDRDKAELLNEILYATGAKIVLSSSWRYIVIGGDMTLRGFEYLLMSHGVDALNRIDGMTKPDEDYDIPQPVGDGTTRILQIVDYLAENEQITQFVAVDDLDLTMGKENPSFIRTDPKVGLTRELADKIIFNLNNPRPYEET